MGNIKCPIHGEQIAGSTSVEVNKAMLSGQLNDGKRVFFLKLIDLDDPVIEFPMLFFEHEYELLKESTKASNQLSLDELNSLHRITCGKCITDYFTKNGLLPEKEELRLRIIEWNLCFYNYPLFQNNKILSYPNPSTIFFYYFLLILATIPPKFEKLERFLLNDATILGFLRI